MLGHEKASCFLDFILLSRNGRRLQHRDIRTRILRTGAAASIGLGGSKIFSGFAMGCVMLAGRRLRDLERQFGLPRGRWRRCFCPVLVFSPAFLALN